MKATKVEAKEYCKEIVKMQEPADNIYEIDCDGLYNLMSDFAQSKREQAEKEKWISVEDKLPEYQHRVLILTKSGARYIGARTITDADGELYIDTEKRERRRDITHWLIQYLKK